jgi:hypothetical protein
MFRHQDGRLMNAGLWGDAEDSSAFDHLADRAINHGISSLWMIGKENKGWSSICNNNLWEQPDATP